MSLTSTLALACTLLQTGTVEAPADLHAHLRAALAPVVEEQRATQDLVGLAVAVVVDGEILEFTIGHEDRDAHAPVSGKTLFRWASISKPVTAIAAMQLVEKGQLDLDARTYVPEFPEEPWPVTCRQLMQHRDGIVNYYNGEVIETFQTRPTNRSSKRGLRKALTVA